MARKYKDKDMTQWFPPSIKPVREGVYNASIHKDTKIFRRWNGREWSTVSYCIENATRSTIASFHSDDIHWRGLNKEPK